ncbi:hopanoid biosynthesis-associated protein HpnK [Deferribacterales bacterium RsTz2092]|nr:hydrolase [Deferribacterales bacterium]
MLVKRYLVVNADDLGRQYCVNEGILRAATEGALTSASLQVNGVAFDDACERVIPACPNLGVGIHICLNEGFLISTPLHRASSQLALADGHFRHLAAKGFIFLATSGDNRAMREQVEAEMRAQIEKALKKVKLDHIDGHQHVHAIPWIFEIAVRLAAYYKIPFIRLPREPLRLSAFREHIPAPANICHWLNLQRYSYMNSSYLIKHNSGANGDIVKGNDCFYGVLHTNAMSAGVASRLLRSHNQQDITEILFHPCSPATEHSWIEPFAKDYCEQEQRGIELQAILALPNILKASEWTLTNYGEL